ncbi:MAG TPA: protein kinase [Chitinispirillaceae bacterium]|nr:protein kinase [Chitinispirillaceae bacterium]
MKIPKGYSHPVSIGSGSFSSVYRAYQKNLERHVALKIIPLKKVSCAMQVYREAHSLSTMRLPCVPHIYDIRRNGTFITIVMEWIYGIPLSFLIRQSLSPSSRMAVAGDIIHAMAILHSANVIHGDVKPDNVIITPERGAVLVDFGFSFTAPSNGSRSKNALQGTPRYMAPELWAENRNADHKKTDLYALGILLRELLNTELPEIAIPLFNANPSVRPDDCVSFEQDWLKHITISKNGLVQKEISNLAAAFTSKMLFDGTNELYAKNRKEEAYALLTESLDIWPENPAALEFLNRHFSLPLPQGNRKKVLIRFALACTAAVALLCAYLIGAHSTMKQSVKEGNLFSYEANDRQGTFLLIRGSSRRLPQIPVILRDVSDKGDVSGTLSVITSGINGRLYIDGQQMVPINGNRFSGILSSGTHRIEMYDSIQKRRYGETIDLLPFSTKTVSLKRFVNE